MAQLPIRQLTLWKQGIGYFERRGLVEERTVTLVVPRRAANDVLTTLNVVNYAGGQVLSVDYETPEDKAEQLRDLSVKVNDRSSIVDLLTSLRGSAVTLVRQNRLTTTGRIIGVEASLEKAGQPPVAVIEVEGETTSLDVVPISELERIILVDDRSAKDVSFFLDVSRVEQTRTTLTVRLDEGAHDLGISYLAPSPTWRVSYRLLRVGDHEAVLTAWGLFENSLEEDLDDVTLTLVSGRPISFTYDLMEAKIPHRPEVSDDQETLQQISANPLVVEAASAISHDLRSPLSAIIGYANLLTEHGTLTEEQRNFAQAIYDGAVRMNKMLSDLLSLMRLRDDDAGADSNALARYYRSGPLGDLKVSGRYFVPVMMSNVDEATMTYRVETPISVKRGQSAMVPLLTAPLEFRPLCVYNGDKMPNHPLLVWEFQNTTGRVLEQGPVTILDNGYAGEGILRFTGVDDSIQIPYALEFGILVTEKTEREPRTVFEVSFDAKKRRALIQRAEITVITYTLVSRLERTLALFIERRDPNQAEYYEMTPAAFQAAGHSRWSIDVPAKAQAEFVVRLRSIFEESSDVMNWTAAFVEETNANGLLEPAQYQRIQDLLTVKQQLHDAADEVKALQEEQGRIQALQEQLRRNLTALGTSERENTVRNQLLNDLEASENRRREIEARIAALHTETREAEARQITILDAIFAA